VIASQYLAAIRYLLTLATLAGFALSWALNKPAYSIIGYTSTAFTVLFWLYDALLWKFSVKRVGISPIPDIGGTWSGWIMPTSTTEFPGPHRAIKAYLVVTQRAFYLRVNLITAESQSVTISSDFSSITESRQLVYTYRNEPRLELQTVSRIHYGTAIFSFGERKPKVMTGQYYTDRLTIGSMRFSEYNAEVVPDFDTAAGLTFAPRTS